MNASSLSRFWDFLCWVEMRPPTLIALHEEDGTHPDQGASCRAPRVKIGEAVRDAARRRGKTSMGEGDGNTRRMDYARTVASYSAFP